MGVIEETYADLDTEVSEDEFREAVESKVEQMAGLADEATAAMLIAHEIDGGEVGGIADIEPGMEEAKFLGKVTRIGDLRTFERDGEDADGQVINIEVADETAGVRVALWDEQANAASEDLEVGQVLRIKGRPKDGYNGLEVSVDQLEVDDDASIDVPDEDDTVSGLALGRSDVTVDGVVLDTDSVRTFDRDDGSEGKVANLTLGDETGRIRVTMWGERTARAEELDPGAVVEVIDGYVRERNGDLELHVGSRGAIEAVDRTIEYVPDTTAIGDLELDQTVDIAGVIRSADPKRTFDRDDGSEGQVRNVRIQDASGDIRVALWGDKADREIGPGDEVQFTDVEIQDGWRDDLEASAGWRSSVTLVPHGEESTTAGVGSSNAATNPSGGTDDHENTTDRGLAAFANDTDTGVDVDTDTDTDPGAVSADSDTAASESTAEANADSDRGPIEEYTGTVVQEGSPVILDNGKRTIRFDAEHEAIGMGERVTVRGRDGLDGFELDTIVSHES